MQIQGGLKIRSWAAIMAIKRNALAFQGKNAFTKYLSSQVAACYWVIQNQDRYQHQNMTMEPQSMLGCANFQSIMPILGEEE